MHPSYRQSRRLGRLPDYFYRFPSRYFRIIVAVWTLTCEKVVDVIKIFNIRNMQICCTITLLFEYSLKRNFESELGTAINCNARDRSVLIYIQRIKFFDEYLIALNCYYSYQTRLTSDVKVKIIQSIF